MRFLNPLERARLVDGLRPVLGRFLPVAYALIRQHPPTTRLS